jgi:hypothetical protein
MVRMFTLLSGLLLAGSQLLPPVVAGPGVGLPSEQPQDLPPGFQIVRDNWETPVEPGQKIHIENLHGDVRVRRNEIPRLDIFVVIQLQEQDPLRADVRIAATNDGLKVDVRYAPTTPEGEAADEGEAEAEVEPEGMVRVEGVNERDEAIDPDTEESEFIRRVDVVAYLPSGSPLHVRTDDDLIEVRETKSEVVAESTGGDLTIITEGAVEARTSSGAILVVLLSDDPIRSSSIETKTGDIRIQVPDNLSIRLCARTAGLISSEYPPLTGDTEGSAPHEMVVRVGDGAHEVNVDSDSGTVVITAWRRGGQGGEGR